MDNKTESKPCECINECETISFSTAISWSQMSTKTVLSEILQSSDVADRFITAMETRHRVQTSFMMETVSLLSDVVDAHTQLRNMIHSYVIVSETSLTTVLSKVLTSMGDMMGGHIASSTSLLATLNDVYLKHVNFLVTGLSTQLDDCDSLTAEAHVIAIRAQSTKITHKEKERLELLQERLEYLSITLVDFDSMLDNSARNSSRQWHYFPDRLLVGDCNTVFQIVNKSLEYHILWLDDFIPTVGSVADTVNAVVFLNMTSLRSNMASLSKCLTSYKEELYSFQAYLNKISTSTSHAEFSYEPPVAILSSFQSGARWLDSISTRYIANEYSKKELMEKIESKVESRVTTPVSRLYSDIQLSLLSEVREHIEHQEEAMVKFYNDLLRRVTSLQRYMFSNDTSLEQFMRRVSIWRMPTFTIQNSQVILPFLNRQSCCSIRIVQQLLLE